jgi:flagella basal body P-ring formation protein FlgA
MALIRAIQAKMGPSAAVTLEKLSVSFDTNTDVPELTAVPEPGSRIGRHIRFALLRRVTHPQTGTRRVGTATAVVRVAIEHVRAAVAVERGVILSDTDLATSHDEVGIAPLAPVPVLADVVGSRTLRNLAAGELVTNALVRVQPLVKSGDTVQVLARVGNVEAVGRAIAQQSGRRHDRVRLINPDSKRHLVGRVTGPGQVEVIHGP